MVDVAKIKRLRERRGLTQEQAAKKAGLGSRQRWDDIESGRKRSITVRTLEQMAGALGVSARQLLK